MSDIEDCPLCSRRFISKGCLSAHLLKDHKPLSCEVCGLGFIWPNAHATHVSGHRVKRTPTGFRVDLPDGMDRFNPQAAVYLLEAASELASLIATGRYALAAETGNGGSIVVAAFELFNLPPPE